MFFIFFYFVYSTARLTDKYNLSLHQLGFLEMSTLEERKTWSGWYCNSWLSSQCEAQSESWDKQALVAHTLRRKEQQMSQGRTEEGPSPSNYKKKDGGGLEGRGSY